MHGTTRSFLERRRQIDVSVPERRRQPEERKLALRNAGQISLNPTCLICFISSYSQRKTFAESAVQTINPRIRAVTSRTWADHASPFQIPSRSDTA
jgi:hypothetical protein